MKKNSRVRRWLAMILCMTLVLSSNVVSMAAEENGTEVQAITEEPVIQETEPAAADEPVPEDITETETLMTETPETVPTEEPATEEPTEEPVDTEVPTETVTEPETPEVSETPETPTQDEIEEPVEMETPAMPEAPGAQEEPGAGEEPGTQVEDEHAGLGEIIYVPAVDGEYPPYLTTDDNGDGTVEGKKQHEIKDYKDWMYQKDGVWRCSFWDDDEGGYGKYTYGPRNQHYVRIKYVKDVGGDIYAICYVRCDLYGGENPEKIYYPVFFIDETGSTLLEENNGRFWESVEKDKKPTKTPDKTNGYWTLGQYDGGLINKEEQLQQVVDKGEKVTPSETTITTQTIFIWHENKEVTSDFTFIKKDDITKAPLPGATFELYQADENGNVSEGQQPLQTVSSKEEEGEKGKVTFSDLKQGTYIIKESSVPSGYVSSDKFQWKLVVDKDGTGRLYNMSGTEIQADGDNQYPVVYNYKIDEHILKDKTATLLNWEERTYRIDLYASHNIMIDIPANVVFTVDVSGSMPWMLSKPTGGTTTIDKLNRTDQSSNTTETGGGSGTRAWTQYQYYVEDDGEYKPIGYKKGSRGKGSWHIIVSNGDGNKVYNNNREIGNRETIYIKGQNDTTKLEALLSSMESFIGKLRNVSPESKVAIVPFAKKVQGGNSSLVSVNNYDFTSFKNNVKLYGGTNQAAGIAEAQDILSGESSTNPNYMLLFTDGKSDSPDAANSAANSAKESGITIFAAGLYNENMAGDEKSHLDNWASEGKDGNKYSYLATTPEGLNSAFNEIFASMNLMISGVTVKDYVDTSRFDIVDTDGNPVNPDQPYGDGGVVGADGSVVWTNVNLGYASDVNTGWHRAIYIKAKDKYMGGNNIHTNLDGSGIDVAGVHLEFLKPTVNVLVRFQVADAEKTIFLGESVEQVFTQEIEDTLTTPCYQETELTDLFDVNKKVTYFIDQELTKPIEAENCESGSLEALKAQKPEKTTTYYVKIAMNPESSSNANPSNPSNHLTNVNKKDREGTYAVASLTIKVVSGSVEVTKKLSETDFKLAGENSLDFEFVLADEKGTEFKQTATITSDGNQQGEYYTAKANFEQLPKGRYTLSESPVEGFHVGKMTLDKGNEKPCDVENNTFLIGQGDDESRLGKRNGIAEVINVLDKVNGSIEIVKEIQGKHHNSYEGDPIFTFKIEKLSEDDKVERTEYKTVRFNQEDETTKSVATLTGLDRGKYRISELSAQKYEHTSIRVDKSTNCHYEFSKDKKSVTVSIGTPNTKVRAALGDKAKVCFINKKTGGNSNTDTDVIVNKFTYDETTGKYEISQELDNSKEAVGKGGKNN